MKTIRSCVQTLLPALALTLALALALAACGSAPASSAPSETPATASASSSESPAEEAAPSPAPSPETTATPTAEPAPTPEESQPEPAGSKVLVVVFSATGTTKGVAEKIAGLTGGDLYEIQPAQPYTEADLNWHDSSSRTTLEQNDPSFRPELAGEPVSLAGYSTVYVGYPIWWGEEPRILDTFVESQDFTGLTVIPFCTSSSSGMGRSGTNLAEHAGTGTWLEGRRFGGGVSEEELQGWIAELN